ncbi:unnamed protein product, partial [Closterium sp. Naga37s-1]
VLMNQILDGDLGTYLSVFSSLTTLKSLSLQYNWFTGTFPSVLVSALSVTELNLYENCLYGTLPAAVSRIKSLEVGRNYFTGTMPSSTSWANCGASSNCFASVGNCGGPSQRSTSCSSICSSTDGSGCGLAAVCVADTDAKITSSLKHSAGDDVAFNCVAIPGIIAMNAADAAAMLNIKSVLGATYTTWTAAAPCRLANNSVAYPGEWMGVYCTDTGKVATISLPNAQLKGSLHADISTLTALTYLDLQANLLNYRLDSFTTNLRFLPLLADIGMVGNYLVGSVPALAIQLRTLDVGYNFLTDVPEVTYTFSMLALKSSLGVTFNNWAATVPCALKGMTPSVPTWSKVLRDTTGNVVSIDMSNLGLTGSLHSDISKLTALTYVCC